MKTAYVFSGQGAQTVGMGKGLYENSPAAKAVFDKADEILGWSVSDICFNGPAEKLTETKYCQVAIYTTSMACLAYYREKNGGDPDEVIGCAGLSLGEYSALAAAGFFTFEEGLKLLEQRALFMDEACRATNGGMASILAGDPAVIAEVCAECGIDVANLNCPGQIVISGDKDGVVKACAMLKEKGVTATFFCTLDHIKKETDLIARMIKEGHIVGNHSTTHPSFAGISRDKMAKEIEETENYLRENFGYAAKYFRFPAGEYNESALELISSLGYSSVFWSVAYDDWDTAKVRGKDYAIEKVMSRLHPGAVILLHSVSKDNADALGEIIDRARAEGYRFESIMNYE